MTTKQKILSKDIWVRTAETQPFFAFLSIIQKMSRTRNLSVIMSLHELDLAGRISDKIACVRGDKVDRFGTPEEIFTEGYIPKLYGMTLGTYDELTGDLELPAVDGEPKIFVIAGNGTGTAVFRRLQRERIPFATGILWENDLDYPSAKALAVRTVSVPAFQVMGEKQIAEAKQLIDDCERVICTVKLPEDGGNIGMTAGLCELLEYAKQKEKEGYVRLSIDEEMWKTYGRKGIDYPNEQYEKLSEIVEMALQKELLSLIQQGKHVVLDFSFWNKANRAYYKRLIEKAGGTPELVYMKASKGTLQKRLYKRNQSLNANSPFIITNEILEHHYNDFQEPCGEGEKVILQE